jgi:uncharacterized Zn finger protein
MPRIFYVTCPGCQGRFSCHYEELRHNKQYLLLCPYCGKRFSDAESPQVEE